MLGASVFGMADVHARFAPFVSQWREGGRPHLFAVTADVTKSFDTLQHGVLKDVISDIYAEVNRYVHTYIIYRLYVYCNIQNMGNLC